MKSLSLLAGRTVVYMTRKNKLNLQSAKLTHLDSIVCVAFLYLLVYLIAILILRWFGIRDCDTIISTCYENLHSFEIRVVNHIHVEHSRMGPIIVIEIKIICSKI